MKVILFTILLSSLHTLVASATVYHKPERRPILELGQLTMDVDHIIDLSQHLYIIAKRKHDPMSAAAIRQNSRLLYLSLLLNPANESSLQLNQTYAQNRKVDYASANQHNKSMHQLKRYLRFLSRSDRNPDEQKLALLLKDILIDLSPSSELVKDHAKNESRWAGVIKPIKEFEKPGTRPLESPVSNDPPSQLGVIPTLTNKNIMPRHNGSCLFSIPFFSKTQRVKDHKGEGYTKAQNIRWGNDKNLSYLKLNKQSFVHYQGLGDIERDQEFSLMCWVKPTGNTTGSIVSRMDRNQQSRGWDLWLFNGFPSFEINHVVHHNWLKIKATRALPLNQWSMLAITYDGSSKASGLKMYVNGKLIETNVEANNLTGSVRCVAPLCISQRYRGELPLENCGIALARMLKNRLGGQQLLRLYKYHTRVPKEQPSETDPKNDRLSLELKMFDAKRGLKDQNLNEPEHQENVKYNTYQTVHSLKLGSNGHVTYSPDHGRLEKNKSTTIQIWLRLEKQGNGSIIAKMDETNEHRGWDVYMRANEVALHLIHSWPGNVLKVMAKQKLTPRKWTYVAITYDGSGKAKGVKIYIDGKESELLISHDNLTKSIATEVPFRLGMRSNGGCAVSESRLCYVSISEGIMPADSIRKTAEQRLPNLNSVKNSEPWLPQKTVGNLTTPPGPLKLHLKSSVIYSPMIQSEYLNRRWNFYNRLAKVQITDLGKVQQDGLATFEVNLAPLGTHRKNPLGPYIPWIQSTISKTYGIFEGFKVEAKTRDYYSLRNKQSLSGPIAIALGSSLMNKPLIANIVVCAEITEEGKLGRPERLWRQLPALFESNESHRIIIGKGAKKDFKQYLAMEQLEFFLLNETLEIEQLSEAVEAATKSNPKIEKASAIFKRLQDNIPLRDIRRVAINLNTKQQLKKILEIYPNHVSAQMLLLWTSDRPKNLEASYAYLTLENLLRKISWMKKTEIKAEGAKAMVEELKLRIDSVKAYLEPKEKDILEEIEDCLPILEAIGMNNSRDSSTAERNITKLKEKLFRARSKLNSLVK